MPQSQSKDEAGDDGHLVRFENVSGHTGAVAHVVSNQIRNHGRVAWVVLWNASLDFSHEIGAYVGCLRIDAATDTHEQRQKCPAKSKSK